MNDDKLRDLFSGFEPKISSDERFLQTLESHLDAVEIVKREVAAEKVKSRHAVLAATLVGFITGIMFSLCVPYLKNIISNYTLTLENSGIISSYISFIAWGIVLTLAVIATFSTYEISHSVFNLRDKKYVCDVSNEY